MSVQNSDSYINQAVRIHTLVCIVNLFARYRATRLCGHCAVYHRKLGPRTIRLNLVTNSLLIS